MTCGALFFGCWQRAGHYHWSTEGRWAKSDERTLTPWGLSVDGKLTPKATRAQGDAALHYKDGWTAVAIHDYTVDKRPGSNSVFLFPAELDFDQALATATEHFPTIVARIGLVTLVQVPNTTDPEE